MANVIKSITGNAGRLPAGPPASLSITERRRISIEWEALSRKTHKGGALPPILYSVIYSFTPPFLFDCRLSSPRRMGIGDQIVLLTAIQAVAGKVGRESIRVWYDPAYPGSADVFDMGGIEAQPIAGAQEYPHGYPQGYTVIPCRGHIFEGSPNNPSPCLHGEYTGNPMQQILWNWGWHELIGGQGIHPRLCPTGQAILDAEKITGGYGRYVTCTPMEVSRMNNNCKAEQWKRVLSSVPGDTKIIFGCALRENKEMRAMISAINTGQASIMLNVPLPVWKAMIDGADAHYTGNSCGMWLGMASNTLTFLLQHNQSDHAHNRMWNYKASWGCANVKLIEP